MNKTNKYNTLNHLKQYKRKKQIKILIFKYFLLSITLFYIFLFSISLFYPLISNIFNKNINHNLLLILTIIFIGVINYIYYNLKKVNMENYFILLIYLVIIFLLINFLSSLISKTLRIGNYHSTLIINNKIICRSIKNINKKSCKINANILWRTNEEYIIKYKNKTYKIPAQYIIIEYFLSKNKKN